MAPRSVRDPTRPIAFTKVRLAVSLLRRKPHRLCRVATRPIARKRHEFTEAHPFGLEVGAASLSRDTRDSRSLDAGVCFGNALAVSKRRRGLRQLHRGLRSPGRQRVIWGSYFVSRLLLGHVRHRVGHRQRWHRSCRGKRDGRHVRSVFRFYLGTRGQWAISDTVIFHASDPIGFPGGIPVSLNLEFAGTLTSTLEAEAVVGVLVQINGVTVANLSIPITTVRIRPAIPPSWAVRDAPTRRIAKLLLKIRMVFRSIRRLVSCFPLRSLQARPEPHPQAPFTATASISRSGSTCSTCRRA